MVIDARTVARIEVGHPDVAAEVGVMDVSADPGLPGPIDTPSANLRRPGALDRIPSSTADLDRVAGVPGPVDGGARHQVRDLGGREFVVVDRRRAHPGGWSPCS